MQTKKILNDCKKLALSAKIVQQSTLKHNQTAIV